MSNIEQWGETIDPQYRKYIQKQLKSNEGLRIVCRGLGLEVNPRHSYDLFINIAVLTYRIFQNANISSDSKVTGITKTGK